VVEIGSTSDSSLHSLAPSFIPPPVVSVPPVVQPLEDISRQLSPHDRDAAAARLRSILTSAMDASRMTAAAASDNSPTRNAVRLAPSSAFPQDNPTFSPDRRQPFPVSRSGPLPWTRLPEMTSPGSLRSSIPGLPSYPSYTRSSEWSKPAEPRPLSRLAPLVGSPRQHFSYSPRLEPLPSSLPGQSNGMLSSFTGASGPRKPPPSMYENMK